MGRIELQNEPILGSLNEHIPYLFEPNLKVLRRSPIRNIDLFQSIYFEYRYIGFIGEGGRFYQRSPNEQFLLTKKASEFGLNVLPPLDRNGDAVYYPFIGDSKTLDKYLPNSGKHGVDIVNTIVEDLYKAHTNGLIYGDRWSHNILIHPHFGLIHIDFDLEISGHPAREFEIAQVAYYTLSAGRDMIAPTLAVSLASHKDWFDIKLVDKFMRGHATYFNNTPFGGIQNETESFLDLLNLLYQ